MAVSAVEALRQMRGGAQSQLMHARELGEITDFIELMFGQVVIEGARKTLLLPSPQT